MTEDVKQETRQRVIPLGVSKIDHYEDGMGLGEYQLFDHDLKQVGVVNVVLGGEFRRELFREWDRVSEGERHDHIASYRRKPVYAELAQAEQRIAALGGAAFGLQYHTCSDMPDVVQVLRDCAREMNALGNALNWPPEMPMSYAKAYNAARSTADFLEALNAAEAGDDS